MSGPLRIGVAIATTGGSRRAALNRCLEAVAAGTMLPARLLVVDQSGDAAGTDIDAPEAGFEVELAFQPPLGLSASRNLALERLTEDIVAVTDDDCVPDPGWLAAIAAAFTEDPELAAVTGPVLPLPAAGANTAAVSSRTNADRQVFHRRTAPWHVGTGGNMAFNRHRLGARRFDTRLGTGSPGRAGEDLDLLDRLLAAGERITYEPEAVVRHERQTPARRAASRYGYGFGVGAMVGLGLRRRDPGAALNLARWLALRGRLAVTRRAIGEEVRVLAGTGAGLVYGIRTR